MPYEIASSTGLDARMVHGSAARRASVQSSEGGKAVPDAGKAPPPDAPKKAPPPPEIDLSRAVESLERYMRESSRNLLISYDEASRRSIITVVDGETGEVVRQIPPAELLSLARRMAENAEAPVLFDGRA